MRLLKLFASGTCAVWLGACATIVEGSNQSVTVSTDPTAATCELKRDGETIGVVNPTPGSVKIGKSRKDVQVTCSKDDYKTRTASLNSSFEGMTLGNLIFGGVIGLAVDAGSGAMHQYPSNITLHLPPVEFQTPQERDQYYDGRVQAVRDDAERLIKRVQDRCGDESQCRKSVREIESRRDQRISELEAERASAQIAGS
jgi:hypothetical protein